MPKFAVPCGKEKVTFEVPDSIDVKEIEPKQASIIKDLEPAIEKSISNPIASKNLSNIAGPDETVAIIVTDTTRKLPEDIIVPILLDKLEESGVKADNITIVNATGTHDPNTRQELIEMLGKEVLDRVKVINHDAFAESELKHMDSSERGIPIVANKKVIEADVRIATGTIEPHLFAGYSGGVKTLSVGVSGEDTIAATHNMEMLEHPKTRLGVIEDNIFREFLNEAALTIGLDFIVDVVQNGEKDVLGIYAGDPLKAFEKGVKQARDIFETEIEKQYDIVISAPGYPKSQNFYQGTRAWNSVVFGPKPAVKKGGTIIIPSPCQKGFGEESLHKWFVEADSPTDVINRCQKEGVRPGQQKALITARVLEHAEVILTNCLIPEEELKDMYIEAEDGLQGAVDRVLKDFENPSLLVMPYGLLTLPILS